MRALDTFLPQFDANETHSISLACEAERALELALDAPAAPGRLVAALFLARGLPPTSSVQGLFARMGFETLSASSTEVVVGASGTPWRPSGSIGPFTEPRPGTVRIATDLRATPVPGGCVLSTETRVLAVDDPARRAFARYWVVVGPFSALIRRRWLRAARDATKRGASGGTGGRS